MYIVIKLHKIKKIKKKLRETYILLPLFSTSWNLKLSCFFSFNRNDNEECYDEDHESDQSVDDSDLNFDEV